MAQLPPGVRSEELLKWMDPRQLAALEALNQLSGPPGNSLGANSRSSSAERRRLQVQTKGETPSNISSGNKPISKPLTPVIDFF